MKKDSSKDFSHVTHYTCGCQVSIKKMPKKTKTALWLSFNTMGKENKVYTLHTLPASIRYKVKQTLNAL